MTEPAEKAPIRMYSKVLGAFLWVVADDRQAEALRVSDKAKDPVYTMTECRELKKLRKSDLSAVHMVKKAFPSAAVESVAEGGRG